MRYVAVLAVVAGCGFRLNATGPGSGGGTSDGPVADVPVSVDVPAAASDTDADGVPDNLDNCPTAANADQRDHDSDGRGDVCDLCPHIAEAADVDTDADGVGDACDPRPTTAGDTRALWVGFYDASDITGWAANATFTVSLGRLTGGDVTNGLAYIYTPQFQRAFAQTSVRVNTLANATGSVTPGAVLYTGDAGAAQYYECEVAQPNNSSPQLYAVAPTHVDQKTWTGTFAAGSEVALTDDVIAGTHTCTAGQGAATVTITQTAAGTQGVVALAGAYANVSFDYLFVVEVGS